MTDSLESAFDAAFAPQPLDQTELDALFHVEPTQTASVHQKGLGALVDVSVTDAERLPLLEVLFERLVRGLSTALRNFTSDAVETTLERFESQRFDDYVHNLALPAIIGVFRAEEWDNYGLLAVDSTLVYATVDALMGGRRGVPHFKIDGRAFTTLELRFVERLMDTILRELSQVFEPISPVNFKLERTETSPRFAAITRPTSTVAVARLRVDMDDRGGRCSIMLPYTTLEPIRNLLVQRFMGEKLGRDSGWDTSLSAAVQQVPIDISALLAERAMPLREALALQVGDLLRFEHVEGSQLELRSRDVTVARGGLYQAAGRYVFSSRQKGA